jgi:isoleucyl-tRNA synthetase
MRGHKVERRFGWDCHGLPIEFEMEKELKLNGKKDIENYGVGKFNEACRSIVLRYTQEWRKTVERMGRWIDFDNDYKTMDAKFMESVWAVFKKLWDKELIYEDKKVLPYSTRITTPLSNFEAGLNYKDIQDPSVTIRLQLAGSPKKYLLVWTTTPWTLPANLAVAVHPDLKYATILDKTTGDSYVIQEDRVAAYFDLQSERFSYGDKKLLGKELVGAGNRYVPLFDFFKGQKNDHHFSPLLGEFVTNDSGTGIVHIAPAFGEDDYNLGKKYNLGLIDQLDEEGRFLPEAGKFAGMYFKDADKGIMQDLKERGILYKQDVIQHSYPFCYRSDTPLMYRAISTWFVKVAAIKDKLLANNAQTHWVPEHLKDGRFGKWLEGARDWAISRNRFWGNPIPIWRDEKTGETECLGSIKELEERSGKKFTDIHKHFIDDVTIKSKKGKTLKRIPHILDCWFESGSMPYAQRHYPFEVSEADFSKIFPADFIAEGMDQTRGWFYTLSVLSTALDKGPAFKNVVVNGIVLAEDGRKMSKSLKNYPPPDHLLQTYGADALRIYLLQSGAVHGEELRFSESGLKEMIRKVLLPLWNAYAFFTTYAHVDKWSPETDYTDKRDHELDRWIDIKLETLKILIQKEMEQYHLSRTVPPLLAFIDDLTNWYIRRSRRRFWKSENDADKVQAYSTLYRVLTDFVKIAAPFIPFVTEAVYQRLKTKAKLTVADSVHLSDYPLPRAVSEEEKKLESNMDRVRSAVELGRELREKLRIKIRQPLKTLFIGTVDPKESNELQPFLHIIQDELNVKEVVFKPFAEMAQWVVKPNFKVLGQKLGPRLRAFSAYVGKLKFEDVTKLLAGGTVDFENEPLGRDAFLIELQASASFKHATHSGGAQVVALDANLDEGLKQEGLARELINRVQKYRKDCGLNVDDRIHLFVSGPAELEKSVKTFQGIVEAETLSTVSWGTLPEKMKAEEDTLNDLPVQFALEKK